MFSFKHPKPVDSRRPVATLVQRHHSRTLEIPVEEAVPEIGAPVLTIAPAAMAFSLHFLVRYTLGEYIGFMWQHAGWLIRRRRVGRFNGGYLRVKSTVTAALHFILLRRASRTYEMTIDDHGIVRVSDRGVTLIGWDDVRLIRRYRNGFLVVLQRGTLPIPYRCLSEADIAALRGFATTLRA
ncbi:YcxB family protein [Massilia sp. S19_KUP03_FR1]|uniref:YcxB family protein n=1 Tax=Massilia sp. S19_KUP03_FR1 TaxID=3025503 RepID=UPI002FCD7C40